MAELVELNLEQSLPFFNGLKNHVDDNKFKELVRKRKHFEYKICSLNRKYINFRSFIEHELKVLALLEDLHIPDGKNLINIQINLIERLVRQITTHFEHQPRAFLFSTRVLQEVKRTRSEMMCWERFLSRHGPKNYNFYLSATTRGMSILETVHNREHSRINLKLKNIDEKLKSGIYLNSTNKISQLEKEKSDLILEKDKSFYYLYTEHMEWSRNIFLNAIYEFPVEKDLFYSYLVFEINNQIFLTEFTENILIEVKDGNLVKSILNEIIRLFHNDPEYLQVVLQLVIDKLSPESFPDIIGKMKETIKNCSKDEEMPTNPALKPITKTDDEIYEEFNRRFPDLQSVRVKSPSVISAEFHIYLEIVRKKLIDNQIDKKNEYPRIREVIERMLIDDDWAPVALDLWWDYYQLEKCVSTPLVYMMILQRAHTNLNHDLKMKLNDRIWEEKRNDKLLKNSLI